MSIIRHSAPNFSFNNFYAGIGFGSPSYILVGIGIIKNKEKLIPIASTDLEINDDEIIEIYKRRWDIEQSYKEFREYFGLMGGWWFRQYCEQHER